MKILFVLLFLFASFLSAGQDCYHVFYKTAGKGKCDSSRLEKVLHKYHKRGFQAFSFGSVVRDGGRCKMYFYRGKRFVIDTVFFRDSQSNVAVPVKRPFDYGLLNELTGTRINQFKNNGYPFAHALLDTVTLREARQCTVGMNFYYSIRLGKKFVFDTIYLLPGGGISVKFLQGLLEIGPGKPYNYQAVRSIPRKIRQVEFIELTGKPKQEFYNGIVRVVLPLNVHRMNDVEALAGLRIENSRLSAYGRMAFNLRNFFYHAEKISFSWERPRQYDQQLKFSAVIPYIFGSPVGFSTDFFAQRLDTSYFNLRYGLTVNYYPSGMNSFGAGINVVQNLANSAPENPLNVRKYLADFTLHLTNTGSLYPVRGYEFDLSVDYGNKVWQDSVFKQLNASLAFARYVKVFQRLTLRLATSDFIMLSPVIFDNEAVFVGGTGIFRGFNPQQFRATGYWNFSADTRWMFDKYTFAFVFAEAGQIYNNTVSAHYSLNTLGLGAGFNFRSGNSLINITYALGTSTPFRFNPRDSKIHISYRLLF